MTERAIRSVTITEDDWMNGGDDASHLTAILVINGVFHHLDAILVTENDEEPQIAVSPDFEDSLAAMYEIGGDGPFDTVTIRGNSYVLVVVPFQ